MPLTITNAKILKHNFGLEISAEEQTLNANNGIYIFYICCIPYNIYILYRQREVCKELIIYA